MRALKLLAVLLFWASASQAELPELGGAYIGAAYTTLKNNAPETKDGLLPGPTLSRSYFIPHASLQYDHEDSWFEWKITPLYWDMTAFLSYQKDKGIEHLLFSSGMLGHALYGRNYLHHNRVRAGIGLGLGENGLDTELLESGYFFTLDLAAKAEVLITPSMVGRFRARYDLPIGALYKSENTSSTFDGKKRPHFLSLDFMLIPESRWYVGIEYWKVLPHNSDDLVAEHFKGFEHKYQIAGMDIPDPIDLKASRLFIHAGLKFYSVDSW